MEAGAIEVKIGICCSADKLSRRTPDARKFQIRDSLKERATIIVSWENSPKKEGAYPKRETDTDRLQKTTKVGLRIQSLMIDYKSL